MTQIVHDNIEKALANLASIQEENGAWNGDYSGSLFLTPFFVCACYVADIRLREDTVRGFLHYLDSNQEPDGGFGLHVEAPSCMFTTVLSYISFRILGRGPDHPAALRAREWILSHGGAEAIPLWGKYILAVMNLYDYQGVTPLPPELWLQPKSSPLHPGRFWCHARMVLLPMCHLYGARHHMVETDLTRELKTEIFSTTWDEIDWRHCRSLVADTDSYVPRNPVLKLLDLFLVAFEQITPGKLRHKALKDTLDRITYEDRTTNYIDIGPVNKLFHTMVAFFEYGPDSEAFKSHISHLYDYLWQVDGFVKVNGYNSTELWDTVFALQSVFAAGADRMKPGIIEKACKFVAEAQVKEDLHQGERYYRHKSKGGWPFSNNPHGWPITDCTAEGIKTCLITEKFLGQLPVLENSLKDAADLILSMQNRDGGWASYELTRGTRLLEMLNSSDVFMNIMIDYSYVECTSSCIQGLAMFNSRFRDHRNSDIKLAIERGKNFLLRSQQDDGSFVGSWGICYTYGTWFGVKGLLAAGVPPDHSSIKNACRFLLGKQMPDNGWGESWLSCKEGRYVPTEKGQVVMTSWALMTLLEAGGKEKEAIDKGVEFLCRRQLDDGSWPVEHIAGIFNKTCAINYDNYRNYFPLWALALYEQKFQKRGGHIGH
ncbi:MAG: terpene cyclase/mutase family protein [Deltaproteobacteria bacterium]|nr:terpene cyclase/mutase family protein [Deltaproteobacteria bacterium]